jgi:hypothetical protein
MTRFNHKLVCLVGLEPTTFRFGGERSNPSELQAQNLVRTVRLELTTFGFVDRRSDPTELRAQNLLVSAQHQKLVTAQHNKLGADGGDRTRNIRCHRPTLYH